jgi:predicted TIM-barrel fold metal-dependent hydrolase
MDVVELAQRFPDVPMICGHSGGDWELGARAVRPYKNIYFEFSGSDTHSTEVDFAVKELGAERIVWGGHIPSRSYATELSKVIDADLTNEQRMLVLGGNMRRLAEPIFKQKGYKV